MKRKIVKAEKMIESRNKIAKIKEEIKFFSKDIEKLSLNRDKLIEGMIDEYSKLEDNDSIFELAKIYMNGFYSFKKNVRRGLKMIEDLTIKDHLDSICYLVDYYISKLKISSNNNSIKLTRIIELLRSGERLNSKKCIFHLANMFLVGNEITQKNIKNTISLLEKGVNLGCVNCMEMLGSIYMGCEKYDSETQIYVGLNVEKDVMRAVEIYKKGADLGSPICMNKLAYLYYTGEIGLQKDIEKTISFYKNAIRLNHYNSMIDLQRISITEGMIDLQIFSTIKLHDYYQSTKSCFASFEEKRKLWYLFRLIEWNESIHRFWNVIYREWVDNTILTLLLCSKYRINSKNDIIKSTFSKYVIMLCVKFYCHLEEIKT